MLSKHQITYDCSFVFEVKVVVQKSSFVCAFFCCYRSSYGILLFFLFTTELVERNSLVAIRIKKKKIICFSEFLSDAARQEKKVFNA